MSSCGDEEKSGDTLEYWIKDSLAKIEFSEKQINDLAYILDPLRPQIEEALGLYDATKDKWKHFRIAIWTAIPSAYEDKVTVLINKWLRAGKVSDPLNRRGLM